MAVYTASIVRFDKGLLKLDRFKAIVWEKGGELFLWHNILYSRDQCTQGYFQVKVLNAHVDTEVFEKLLRRSS